MGRVDVRERAKGLLRSHLVSCVFVQADNYRSEVEELRSNLSSSLESYSKMGR